MRICGSRYCFFRKVVAICPTLSINQPLPNITIFYRPSLDRYLHIFFLQGAGSISVVEYTQGWLKYPFRLSPPASSHLDQMGRTKVSRVGPQYGS